MGSPNNFQFLRVKKCLGWHFECCSQHIEFQEAQVARRFSGVVSTFATLLPIATAVLLHMVEAQCEDFEDDFKQNFHPVFFFVFSFLSRKGMINAKHCLHIHT